MSGRRQKGFIGTGGIAQGHMERLASIVGVENVAFCDVAMDRAQAAAEHPRFGGVRALAQERQRRIVYCC